MARNYFLYFINILHVTYSSSEGLKTLAVAIDLPALEQNLLPLDLVPDELTQDLLLRRLPLEIHPILLLPRGLNQLRESRVDGLEVPIVVEKHRGALGLGDLEVEETVPLVLDLGLRIADGPLPVLLGESDVKCCTTEVPAHSAHPEA